MQVLLINHGDGAVRDDAGHAHRAAGDRTGCDAPKFGETDSLGRNKTWKRRLWLNWNECQSSLRHGAEPALVLWYRLVPGTPVMPLLPRKGFSQSPRLSTSRCTRDERPVSARLLAERHNLPPRHLEPVLQALVHEGIFQGIRGPRGGYSWRASAGADQRRGHPARGRHRRGRSRSRPAIGSRIDSVVLPAVADAESAFTAALAQLSIEDLTRAAREPARSNVAPGPRCGHRRRTVFSRPIIGDVRQIEIAGGGNSSRRYRVRRIIVHDLDSYGASPRAGKVN